MPVESCATNCVSVFILVAHGIAVHHASMTRRDRELVPSLFEGLIVKVIVSTATLA